MENFEIPFETRPPRLKDLVSKHIMGDVWIRDTPFGAVTDSLVLAKKFGMKYTHILRAIDNCNTEFGLALLLLYINSPKARLISAEIIYRFFILKSYITGLNENQLGALKGYYRKQMRDDS